MNIQDSDDETRLFFYLGSLTGLLTKGKLQAKLKKSISEDALMRSRVKELSETLNQLLKETTN